MPTSALDFAHRTTESGNLEDIAMADIHTIPADLSPRADPINADRPVDSASWWPFIGIAVAGIALLALYFR
jgi:hypothetical protein